MKILKIRFTEIKPLLILLFSLPLTLLAQLVDYGTYMRTDDNLTIGINSDSFPFYVRKNASGWQTLFRNRDGDGADVYIANGAGHGMLIKGRTTNAKYTLRLQNLNDDTNVFYNNGKVGLGLHGNVGIGITSPIHKLHVQVTGRDGIRLEGNNTGDAIFQISNGGGTHYIFDDDDDQHSLEIESANDLVFNTNGPGEKMRIKENGFIGIGTAAPIHKLHVQVAGRDGIRIEGNNTGDAIFQISNGGGTHYIFDDDDDQHSLEIESANDLVFNTNGASEKMRIKESGKVSIGNVITTSNNYKLFVESGILTEKVKVAVKSTGDWSDYVFEDNYEVMPIDELEEYVTKNKHLPNVPSAEEVVENGLNVATMDAKLLEKIEEAHLYIIEINKLVKRLKAEVFELKNIEKL